MFEIARENSPLPSGSGQLGGEFLSVNNSDKHVFSAGGIAVVSPDETVVVLQSGQSAPDGNGILDEIRGIAINDSNDIGAVVRLSMTAGGGADDFGIYLLSDNTVQEIVREGEPSPDGNGLLANILHPPVMNNASQFALNISLTDTDEGSRDNQGIFLADATGIQRIVRNGDVVPDGNGVFANFFPVTTVAGLAEFGINDSGHIAFQAQVDTAGDGIGDLDGLYLWDGDRIITVAQTDEPLLGSKIESFSFDGERGFNDQSQLAFSFQLENGDSGVALFTPVPEPATITLVLCCFLLLPGMTNRHFRPSSFPLLPFFGKF